MNRRGFLGAIAAAVAAPILIGETDERDVKRVYSFPSRRVVPANLALSTSGRGFGGSSFEARMDEYSQFAMKSPVYMNPVDYDQLALLLGSKAALNAQKDPWVPRGHAFWLPEATQ